MSKIKIDDMKKMSLDDIKAVELDILAEIDRYCNENGLTYWIAYGTLLGAIRHKGFIPWDDDIDIVMPRKDYEFFCRNFNKGANKKWYVHSYPENKEWYYTFAKVIDSRTVLVENVIRNISGLGVFVDVFPLDGLPAQDRKASLHMRRCRELSILNEKLQRKQFQEKYKQVVIKVIRIGFPAITRIPIWIQNKIALQFDYNSSKRVAYVASSLGIKDALDASVCKERVRVAFESIKVYAPANYHEILTALYGDYLMLPPKEKQVSTHDFDAYYKV